MASSLITDDMRRMVGKWQGEPYVGGEVHVEDIRKFAKAVGDNNPLWLDMDYARGTRWGGIIAPPTFIDRFSPFYVLADDNSQGYLGGPLPIERPFKHGFSAGDEYENFRPVRPGDVIIATTTLGDMFEKQSRPGIGRMLFLQYVKTYRNQHNQVVSICRWTSVCYEGPTAGEPVPGTAAPPASEPAIVNPVTPTIEQEALWTTPIYFEDVTEGEELTPLSRLQTQKRFVRYAQASNDLSDIHYDYKLMQSRGMPDVVGQGALSAAYIASMLTNWCTPDGFLEKLSVQYRHYSFPGDVLTTRGVVTEKRQEGGDHLVSCDVWAENQYGRRVTIGHAVVSLPVRHG
jgi:acyl dehydratase